MSYSANISFMRRKMKWLKFPPLTSQSPISPHLLQTKAEPVLPTCPSQTQRACHSAGLESQRAEGTGTLSFSYSTTWLPLPGQRHKPCLCQSPRCSPAFSTFLRSWAAVRPRTAAVPVPQLPRMEEQELPSLERSSALGLSLWLTAQTSPAKAAPARRCLGSPRVLISLRTGGDPALIPKPEELAFLPGEGHWRIPFAHVE